MLWLKRYSSFGKKLMDPLLDALFSLLLVRVFRRDICKFLLLYMLL